jgi:hypothetical protein
MASAGQSARRGRAGHDDRLWQTALGVDLVNGGKALEEGLAANREAILLAYVRRQYDTVATPTPVFAPPELLDDDPEDQKRK